MKYAILAVEGQHDIELLGRVLKAFGLAKVQYMSSLDVVFRELIPSKYPASSDGNILARVPVPIFFQDENIAVAVLYCEGDTQIVSRSEASLRRIQMSSDVFELFSFGIVLDSDAISPVERFDRILSHIRSKFPDFSMPTVPGDVAGELPRVGVYVMPNNADVGTLEDLLLECASAQYSELLGHASQFVSAAHPCVGGLSKKDREQFQAPSGEKKAIVSAISGLLRPGKAIQVSISDNCWVPKQPADFAGHLSLLADFVSRLLGLPR